MEQQEFVQSDPQEDKKEPPKLPVIAYILCGWPIVLVFIGGAVGGGLGGAACGINLGIYKSEMPVPAKAALIIVTGLAAYGLWFAVVTTLGTAIS